LKKIAIFVEGVTERELVIEILNKILQGRNLHIQLAEQFANKIVLTGTGPDGDEEVFVLLVNCCGDEQVKTQIRDNFTSLVNAGYTEILGLRDVFPYTAAELQKVAEALSVGLPVAPFSPSLHLAVMEVESWFLDEVAHFERIHMDLTEAKLVAHGYDLRTNMGETWPNPALTLHQIYSICGRAYLTQGRKTLRRIRRTLRALDMDRLLNGAAARNTSLSNFLSSLKAAVAHPG